jgi:hypothetical protein
MKYNITLTQGHNLGDTLCFLDACRKFAHKNGCIACVEEGKEIVEAYQDDLLEYSQEGLKILIPFNHRLRPSDIEQNMYTNYLGHFLASLGIFEPYPILELPVFDKGPSYAVIQPFSLYATNPPVSYVQGIVDTFIEKTGLELFAIGKQDTPQNLNGVNYSLLKNDVVHLMRIIQDAIFVLTPRSLAANVAAGYVKPSFVWCVDDGYNWHLDYPGWNHIRVLWKHGLGVASNALAPMIEKYIFKTP